MILNHLNGIVLPSKKQKIPYRIKKIIFNNILEKNIYYDSESVEKEWQLLLRLLSIKDKKIIHNTNGERDLKYILKFFGNSKRIKFFATFHKPPLLLKKIIENNQNLKKSDGVIALGSKQKSFLTEKLKDSKVTLIHHGVDTEFFIPKDNIDHKNNPRSILFVGQHLRDFETLNYIIHALKNKNLDMNIKVVINPANLQFLKNKNFLKIYSNISDYELKTLYQNATCLFLPLKDVTACNAILESLACGTPVISNNVGDNSDYLTQECSNLINVKDRDNFVDTIEKFVKNGNNKKMREAARKKALEFDWKIIAKKVNNFYKEVCF